MVNHELERLKNEHARLHIAVEKMSAEENTDEVRLAVMKKRKLWIKDKIVQIERQDQVAVN
tara:strand:- start:177 stop:359 length:183 start_codon:yes stop_codon:yes gene_type:complete